MYYRPHTMSGRVVTAKMSGTGMGSILLDKGGPGVGSSYSSIDNYLATTGGAMKGGTKGMRSSKGLGVGGAIEDKLAKLVVRPIAEPAKKKMHNIKFSL